MRRQCRLFLLLVLIGSCCIKSLGEGPVGAESQQPRTLVLQLLPLDVRNGYEASLGKSVLVEPAVQLQMFSSPALPMGVGYSSQKLEELEGLEVPAGCSVRIQVFCEAEPDSEAMSISPHAGNGEEDYCEGKSSYKSTFGCDFSSVTLDISAGFWRIVGEMLIEGNIVATGSRSFEVLKPDIARLPELYRMHSAVHPSSCNRASIINRILELKGYRSYLEIGVQTGVNFERIRNAEFKIGVDPVKRYSGLNYTMTSDKAFDLFRQSHQCFDLIFIDGLHISDQVDKDIQQSLEILCIGGMVLLHDCNPSSSRHASRIPIDLDYDDWSQPPDGGCPWPTGFRSMRQGWGVMIECSESVNGEWSGDVWRSFVRFRCMHDSSLKFLSGVIDCDWGIGFIIPQPPEKRKLQQEPDEWCKHTNPSWSYFSENRVRMTNLISQSEFFESFVKDKRKGEYENVGDLGSSRQNAEAIDPETSSLPSSDSDPKSALVVYVYFERERSVQNLEFFLEQVSKYDNAKQFGSVDMHYLIVINGKKCSVPIPQDSRFHTIPIENTGSDFAAHYVALSSCIIQHQTRSHGKFCEDMNSYDYFFFINSSCRGPFLAPFLQKLVHWTTPFTSLLSDTVKLVGPSLHLMNILTVPEPILDGYFLVTDYTGLNIMLDAGVFQMHTDLNQTIFFGEQGATRSIIAAGYNVDTLAAQYQGFDWQDKTTVPPSSYPKHFKIEFAQNLNQIRGSSGLESDLVYALHPYETVFIKTVWGEGRGDYTQSGNPLWKQDQPRQDGARCSWVQEEASTRFHWDRGL